MSDFLDLHDLLHAGVTLGGVAIAIAVIKTDIRWIKKWSEDHQKSDDASFETARDDIRELRTAMREMENRR
jgi:predicted NBD/HSP70 family sugar kinase